MGEYHKLTIYWKSYRLGYLWDMGSLIIPEYVTELFLLAWIRVAIWSPHTLRGNFALVAITGTTILISICLSQIIATHLKIRHQKCDNLSLNRKMYKLFYHISYYIFIVSPFAYFMMIWNNSHYSMIHILSFASHIMRITSKWCINASSWEVFKKCLWALKSKSS